MEVFYEQNQINVKKKVDIVVIGGGPAGVASAVYASRNGAKTLLVESYGIVGGMATIGLMNPWSGEASGGFTREILEELNCDFSHHDNNPEGPNRRYNPEEAKMLFLNKLLESNVELLLYTQFTDVIMDNDKIEGVIVESKSGREAIKAKIIIDCTGDGDVAARAGVPFKKGRDCDGKLQPATLMFRVAGVEPGEAKEKYGFLEDIELPGGSIRQITKRARENGELPYPLGHVLLYKQPMGNVVTVNMTNAIGIDGTSAEDKTRAEIICRKQIPYIIKFIRKYIPGYENCYLLDTASYIGIRETRRITCEYTLTEEDIADQKKFQDRVVTKVRFNNDVHNVSGPGEDESYSYGNSTGYYSIPYRCFVPVNCKNLLVSGRCISGTHLAHSNYRVMVPVLAMGQASGTAGALCIKNDVTPRELDVKKLQKVLKEQGIKI